MTSVPFERHFSVTSHANLFLCMTSDGGMACDMIVWYSDVSMRWLAPYHTIISPCHTIISSNHMIDSSGTNTKRFFKPRLVRGAMFGAHLTQVRNSKHETTKITFKAMMKEKFTQEVTGTLLLNGSLTNFALGTSTSFFWRMRRVASRLFYIRDSPTPL